MKMKKAKKTPKRQQGWKEETFTDYEASPRGVLEMIPRLGAASYWSNSGSSSTNSGGGGGGSIISGGDRSSPTEAASQPPYTPRLRWKKLLKSVRRLSTIPLLSSYDLSRKTLRRKLSRLRADAAIDCGGGPVTKPSWRSFTYQELAAATDNFSPENLIGKGGHAKVYKGILPDGQLVAVKSLIKQDEDKDRTRDFLSELGIIAHINHPNAARLFGFSIDNGLHLVLQLAPHGSLASLLHGSAECLPWTIRFKVALGVAVGLQYLHHGCPRRIIHRDIKASNILLSEDYEPQISDFGIAKWLPEKWAHHIIFPIEGTFGYLAPEYFMHGIANEKSDVFAFGVLLLELITGRHAVDLSQRSLVMLAKPLLKTCSVNKLVDQRLGDSYEPTEMTRVMTAALMCIDHLSAKRPNMIQVVQLLMGEEGAAETKHSFVGGRALLLDALDVEDYTSTSYLKDLDRHKQLVLE